MKTFFDKIYSMGPSHNFKGPILRAGLSSIIFLFSTSAFAKMNTWTVGSLCPSNQLQVQVVNPTPEETQFWIYTDFDQAIHEDSFQLSEHSKLKLSGFQINNQNHGFLIKSLNDKIQIQISCQNRSWTPNNLNSSTKKIITSSRNNYYVTNLHHEFQTLQFQFKNHQGKILSTENVMTEAHLETTTFKFTPPSGTSSVEILGEGRFNLHYENPLEENLLTAQDLKSTLTPELHGSYFLVTQQSGNDSFVIHLTDPALIERARDIIQKKLAKMVVGLIGAGPQNHNRNFSVPLKTPWSWNVEKVLNFNDFASNDCNISPGQIEESRNAILNSDSGGLVCFWGFFPTKELQVDELR